MEALTRQLTEALKLVDLRLSRHIIVADNATLSMSGPGLI
ncbi:hypothetical protein N5K27_28815 [Pigmentiphaga sp. GD03639]|nr:JAB domain-containing protein [Pigmentiphaga sp. GD03639]MDH2240299.1 hypothetical protein [Pigmentiphaga sp. GD03639]